VAEWGSWRAGGSSVVEAPARFPLASSHRLSELVSHNSSLLQSVFDFYVLILNREPVVVMRAV
jgi:hypothetical protein